MRTPPPPHRSAPPSGPAFVAYLRVSTKRQGDSGLGLDAQRAAIAAHVAREQGRVLAEYTEVESGRRTDRPKLAEALAHARADRVTLVIARLDRLARNVAFLSALMEVNAPFIALDVPSADRLTLHVLAAVAESEARAISTRTRAALQAAKQRGVKLGTPANLNRADRLRGAAVQRDRARATVAPAAAVILQLRHDHHWSLSKIATWLNTKGFRRPSGKRWHPSQVARVLGREIAAGSKAAA